MGTQLWGILPAFLACGVVKWCQTPAVPASRGLLLGRLAVDVHAGFLVRPELQLDPTQPLSITMRSTARPFDAGLGQKTQDSGA